MISEKRYLEHLGRYGALLQALNAVFVIDSNFEKLSV